MRLHARAVRRGLLTLMLASASMGFGPDGPGAKVTKEQLEYSKQMFGEGEKAMAAGNFSEALAKYQEGYRYAPHLHVFTFNIASAADAMDDCRTAQQYFQMFVDLVPKHPKLKQAKKRLATLNEECRYDEETASIAKPGEDSEAVDIGGSGGKDSREKREAARIMNELLTELHLAGRTYTAAKAKFPDVKPFGRAARRKKKHYKKLRQVAVELGIEMADHGTDDVDLAHTAKNACREAKTQEKKISGAVEKMLERYDTKDAYKVGNKILKASDRRDRQAFDACS